MNEKNVKVQEVDDDPYCTAPADAAIASFLWCLAFLLCVVAVLIGTTIAVCGFVPLGIGIVVTAIVCMVKYHRHLHSLIPNGY